MSKRLDSSLLNAFKRNSLIRYSRSILQTLEAIRGANICLTLIVRSCYSIKVPLVSFIRLGLNALATQVLMTTALLSFVNCHRNSL